MSIKISHWTIWQSSKSVLGKNKSSQKQNVATGYHNVNAIPKTLSLFHNGVIINAPTLSRVAISPKIHLHDPNRSTTRTFSICILPFSYNKKRRMRERGGERQENIFKCKSEYLSSSSTSKIIAFFGVFPPLCKRPNRPWICCNSVATLVVFREIMDLDYIIDSRIDSGKERLSVVTRLEPESTLVRQETYHYRRKTMTNCV